LILAYFILNETIKINGLIGIIFIVVGIIFIAYN
jgi:drug/metabolite transporter (DMT)-like permease